MDRETEQEFQYVEAELNRLWRYLEHKGDAEKARRESTEWQRRSDDLRKELDAYLIKMTQQTSQYVNVVSVIGYAGYFAVWSFTRALLTETETSLVALLGLTSLGLYCFWEIFVIQFRLAALGRMGALMRDAYAPDIFEQRRAEMIAYEAKATQATTPVWQAVLAICIGTVVIGGATMARRFYLTLPPLL